MLGSDIRRTFLDFFAERGHAVVPSSSLVPHNDPTLYFTNAGMVQFKDVFTGVERRPYSRATTSQRCLRVSGKHNDLDNVGRTPRHHTMFEMLGNFSFGDYFKADAIPFAWELLTQRLGIDPDRLWVTVYEEDDEAEALWRDVVGVPARRIQRLGAKENFWSMGDTGPCGPCSEIHYDHGAQLDPNDLGPASESPRYVEIWNLVFMQFEQRADGTRVALPRPSIDTGAGLERVAAVLQGVTSNYDTDLFRPLVEGAARDAGIRYGDADGADTALRVIADHSRATALLIADGVMPSNEGRGYVLRRIMRRAIRFGVQIGLDKPFFHNATERVLEAFAPSWPDLKTRSGFVREVVFGEEERFRRTLERGTRLLDGELDSVAKAGGTLAGDVAFTLSDTYGFPLDLTQLIAAERGVTVDEAGYHAALGLQRARGRAAWKGSGEVAVGELWNRLVSEHGTTTFTGYDRTEDVGTVVALVKTSPDGTAQTVDRLESGEAGIVLVDRTPFYAESGGQVGDVGTLGGFAVHDTTVAMKLVQHRGVASEPVFVGDVVAAVVDSQRRNRTRRNHTGTHLLHAALRAVLGTHVAQKGSLVGPERLRFDFSHHLAPTRTELDRVEDIVNDQILGNNVVQTAVEDLESAVSLGAMALFGEKYEAEVRVVRVADFSTELCGGTHVASTGDIGLLRIVSEGGIAAGVRRIEAQTGSGALRGIREQTQRVVDASERLKASPDRLAEAVAKLLDDRKALEKDLLALRGQLAGIAARGLIDQAVPLGGTRVLITQVDGDVREQAERLLDLLASGVVVLFGTADGSVRVVATVSKDVVARVHAGNLVQALATLLGGRGGGRPDLAQAGGPDTQALPSAIAEAQRLVTEALARS